MSTQRDTQETKPPYLVGVTDDFPGGNDDDLVEWAFDAGIRYQAHQQRELLAQAWEKGAKAQEVYESCYRLAVPYGDPMPPTPTNPYTAEAQVDGL